MARRKKWKDKLPGGLADERTPEDFDPVALARGLKVELEHTSDRDIATEIAMDHLTEDPDYYEKLATIESHGNPRRRRKKNPEAPTLQAIMRKALK